MLSEVTEPRRRFAKTAIGTMIGVGVLFVLANIAYVSSRKALKFHANAKIVLRHQEGDHHEQ